MAGWCAFLSRALSTARSFDFRVFQAVWRATRVGWSAAAKSRRHPLREKSFSLARSVGARPDSGIPVLPLHFSPATLVALGDLFIPCRDRSGRHPEERFGHASCSAVSRPRRLPYSLPHRPACFRRRADSCSQRPGSPRFSLAGARRPSPRCGTARSRARSARRERPGAEWCTGRSRAVARSPGLRGPSWPRARQGVPHGAPFFSNAHIRLLLVYSNEH